MLLLSEGSLIDGTGSGPIQASLLIEGREIVAVGPVINPPPESAVIDCRGLTIAPAFFDLHSHSDLQVLARRKEKLKQGVTAEVVGNCGFSPFPVAGDPAALQSFAAGILGKPDGWGWPTARAYLNALADAGGSDDAYPLAGHGSLRIAVHGLGQEALSSKELEQIAGLTDDCLDAGCVGVSTGLMYAPGSAANAEELLRICRVVAARDKLYTSHIRGYGETLVQAVAEQIELAAQTGCRLQISHLQAAGRRNWHLLEPALDRIESARASGIDVEFDIYPYQCGSTVLTQFLPQWALDGGTPALIRRIESPQTRSTLEAELNEASIDYWSDVTISSVDSSANADLIGKTVTEIAAIRQTNEGATVLALLQEELAAVNIVSFNQSEENLRRLITHPLCSVITDGFYVKGNPHPRLHGTYPELLGTVVRERKWLSLEEAVHKSSAKPIARVRLPRRGVLQAGYLADIVVFDAAHVAGNASYTQPERDPYGISFVLKRGEMAYQSSNAPASELRAALWGDQS